MFYSDVYFIPECDLLYFWYTLKNMNPKVVEEFGKKYFKVNQEEIDEICYWMDETRETFNNGKTIEMRYKSP